MNKEVLNKIDNNAEDNNNGSSYGILKYVFVSFVLLVKIFAFMHINQNDPSDQSNPSDNKSSVSETEDTPSNEKVETPYSVSFHSFFYSHTGWGHVIIDVLIYLFLAVLFVIVSIKSIRSLFPIKDGNKK